MFTRMHVCSSNSWALGIVRGEVRCVGPSRVFILHFHQILGMGPEPLESLICRLLLIWEEHLAENFSYFLESPKYSFALNFSRVFCAQCEPARCWKSGE